MEVIELKITEYIDDLASKYFVESVGTIPKDNEALFTRMRVKKSIEPIVELNISEEKSNIEVSLKTSEISLKDKDSILEKFYITEWEKAYKKAVLREIMLRIAGE